MYSACLCFLQLTFSIDQFPFSIAESSLGIHFALILTLLKTFTDQSSLLIKPLLYSLIFSLCQPWIDNILFLFSVPVQLDNFVVLNNFAAIHYSQYYLRSLLLASPSGFMLGAYWAKFFTNRQNSPSHFHEWLREAAFLTSPQNLRLLSAAEEQTTSIYLGPAFHHVNSL